MFSDLVYIHGIKDEVYIFSSLQKPKRIIILGSDGNEYPMMCKPKVYNSKKVCSIKMLMFYYYYFFLG